MIARRHFAGDYRSPRTTSLRRSALADGVSRGFISPTVHARCSPQNITKVYSADRRSSYCDGIGMVLRLRLAMNDKSVPSENKTAANATLDLRDLNLHNTLQWSRKRSSQFWEPNNMTPTPTTTARERVGALALSTLVATYGCALFLAVSSTIHVGWFLAAINLLIAVPLAPLLLVILCKSRMGRRICFGLFLVLSSLLPPALLLLHHELTQR